MAAQPLCLGLDARVQPDLVRAADLRLLEEGLLGVASHWPFESWGRFLPEHPTAVALLDRLLHHSVVVVTSGDSCRMKEARQKGGCGPPMP